GSRPVERLRTQAARHGQGPGADPPRARIPPAGRGSARFLRPSRRENPEAELRSLCAPTKPEAQTVAPRRAYAKRCRTTVRSLGCPGAPDSGIERQRSFRAAHSPDTGGSAPEPGRGGRVLVLGLARRRRGDCRQAGPLPPVVSPVHPAAAGRDSG